MVFMLPTATDNGARLAAILPSGLAAVARGLGRDPSEALDLAFPNTPLEAGGAMPNADALPAIRSFVMVVVDGLGYANLKARTGHAPTLAALQQRRIETVAPSTTAAALTALTTGCLPGEHGLIGYMIRHPKRGLIVTLSDWEDIGDASDWQRAQPLFHVARELGARRVAIGRPAHAQGGLTEAILAGADYLPGQRIEDRFSVASRVLRTNEPTVAYLYVDELDKVAHEHGWQSDQWVRRLEQLDTALAGFLRTLPSDVGVAITADHGMVDVQSHQQVLFDSAPELMRGVTSVGGEPRLRSLYLEAGVDPVRVAREWAAAERDRAWVMTREELTQSGVFGPTSPEVADRLGDVIIAARKQVAYYQSTDDARSRAMIGQHGSFSEYERGVPLISAGALAGSGFASYVTRVATSRLPRMQS